MTTFCGGNISASDLAREKQRARFITTALTGKHLCSAELGACITKKCQELLGVGSLCWKKGSFEGNVSPASSEIMADSRIELDIEEGYYNGFGMRNTMHNGIFAKAVVIPFPDMKWVQEGVTAKSEAVWITEYVNTITQAVLSYGVSHPLE